MGNNINEKGFLPINECYSETMTSPQEMVEANPRQFIIEECIPACLELWKNNIYTFMVSDHLNEGVCWIEVIADSLSEENKKIYETLIGDDIIKFSYHHGTLNFGVSCVGVEGQQKLLELAKQFKMQDVPKNQAYFLEEDFLMNYCDCYEEYKNPNYRYMTPPWETEISIEYMREYDKWESSDESREVLRRCSKDKMIKSVSEYAREKGMIYEDGRIYLSDFHYRKHCNYREYIQTISSIEHKPSGRHI